MQQIQPFRSHSIRQEQIDQLYAELKLLDIKRRLLVCEQGSHATPTIAWSGCRLIALGSKLQQLRAQREHTETVAIIG
jgi:hypothetical protein